ncbi:MULTISPECIES: pirin family protein [Haloferax]|uniref:Pirin family protein n=2 Tax=Haloferax TaxID=2251 RepID=A0A6G1Z5Z2_9EURY|nr:MULTISPECIES: pirin family protein [Haloferax]KAB1185342.1 pirin family protein [Haloferax sp. CBA1149]MRW81979.1 pirin family protein [Haloferax marinisediminis]
MNAEDTSKGADVGPISGEMVRHGTGVNSNRAFPTTTYPKNIDPFVLFERFYIDPDKGFPTHPHRGFEIVSYMLDGGMDHEDSLGVFHTASEGDVMRITTGRGIRHSEFPAGGHACNGLQLWVNLPADDKDVDPNYTDASAEELPTELCDGAAVTTVVGEGSPIELYTPMEYLDVHVDDSWTWSVETDWAGFLYGISGTGTVDGDDFGEGDVLPVTGRCQVNIQSEGTLRVVAVSGRPHGEPIRQRGPFVL